MWAKIEREDFRRHAFSIGAKTKTHFLDVPIEIEELLASLEAGNKQAGDDVTLIPLSEMYEYLSHFEAPDAEEMALNFHQHATSTSM